LTGRQAPFPPPAFQKQGRGDRGAKRARSRKGKTQFKKKGKAEHRGLGAFRRLGSEASEHGGGLAEAKWAPRPAGWRQRQPRASARWRSASRSSPCSTALSPSSPSASSGKALPTHLPPHRLGRRLRIILHLGRPCFARTMLLVHLFDLNGRSSPRGGSFR
jgi:hypothetical protein